MTQSAVVAQHGASDYSGTFRNKIINGDMRIDQRNAGASVTSPNGYQTIDRWKFYIASGSKFNAQQVTDAPAGFTNSLKLTSSSSYTLGSTDFFSLVQAIEGYNTADWAFGTSSAKTLALSFWVKSSLTGVFGGNIGNSARNRQYYFTYTISSANTWTYVSLSIPGDTTGTWATDNTVGLLLEFGLGAGTSVSVASGSWTTSGAYSVTGAVSLVSTNAATLQFTGVQLETGSSATAFERRPFGMELQLCQRYYIKWLANSTNAGFGMGRGDGSSVPLCVITYPTQMRTNPTLTQFNTLINTPTSYTVSGISSTSMGTSSALVAPQMASGTVTSGFACAWIANASTAYIELSAEL
jgi:hypothetical protein